MKRIYDQMATRHFASDRQMLFLMGPRQVGKTTTALRVSAKFEKSSYLNWDNQSDRRTILRGPEAVAGSVELSRLRKTKPLVVFDEIHKYRRWKDFLKGFFDKWEDSVSVFVTGSARLSAFKAGGDSLMGRYFSYRQHPLSVAELLNVDLPEKPINKRPLVLDDDRFEALWRFGGFPEPFLKADMRFFNRWRRLRSQQLFKEDLRDLSRIQELGQVETLAELVRQRVASLVSYTSLAREVSASIDSIKRWLKTLQALYYCFSIRPWHKNVSRALRKEPKYYLWDWSLIDDSGARAENMTACALLKAVHFWTDHGFGEFDLRFLRDKQKREVDFIVVRDGNPWFLVEVKYGGKSSLSPSLEYFENQLGCEHAFQLSFEDAPVERDCFEVRRPVIVPARTFLAQLV